MSLPIERRQVVAQARAWLGTPFHHQARLRGVGVDCIGLVIGVARDLHLVPAGFDIGNYPRVPDGVSLMEQAHAHLTHIEPGAMQAGDVLVVCFDKDPQHFGILADYRHGGLSLVHAASSVGCVIETRLMFSRAMQFVAAFRLPGLNLAEEGG